MTERKSRIAITKVYTRKGDSGDTDLGFSRRVAKDTPRIDAVGTVDELNATIGQALAWVADSAAAIQAQLAEPLTRVQNELFDLGSELAMAQDFVDGMPAVQMTEVQAMEKLMDRCNKDLQPLRSFVLPGGGHLACALHVARTVCRRAERDVLRLSRQEAVRPEALKYLNRLSDLLFVLSRWAVWKSGAPEVLWQPQKTR